MLLCMMLKKVIKMTIAQGLGHTFLAVILGLGITPITTPPPPPPPRPTIVLCIIYTPEDFLLWFLMETMVYMSLQISKGL